LAFFIGQINIENLCNLPNQSNQNTNQKKPIKKIIWLDTFLNDKSIITWFEQPGTTPL
jgi:hypothetical protein